MCYTIMNSKEILVTKQIFTVEDFEERLSECAIGTEQAKELMEFVQLMDRRYKWASKRCDVAAQMLGHDMISECMVEEEDV